MSFLPSRYQGLPTAEERAARAQALKEQAERATRDAALRSQAEAGVERLGLGAYVAGLSSLPLFQRRSLEKHARDYEQTRQRRAEQRKADEARAEQRKADEAAAVAEVHAIEDAYLAAVPDDEGHTDAHLFDERGEPYPGPSPANLRELAAQLKPGASFGPTEANHWQRVRTWHEAGGGKWPAEYLLPNHKAAKKWYVRNWAVTHDNRSVVPPGLNGARLREWLLDWRDSIAAIRACEVIAFARPGQRVSFVTWWEEATSGVEWAERISGKVGEDERPRFESGTPHGRPFSVPCAPLYLPSAHASAAGSDAAAVFAAAPSGRLVTGWPALDNLFRGKPGLPLDSRVTIGGDPKQGKSTFAIDLARAALAQGFHVGWLTRDESPRAIMVRRLQQLGLSPAEADEPPPAALAKLSAQPLTIADGGTLEDFWESEHAKATEAGLRFAIVLDSLQTVVSAAGAGKGEREALEATIKAIEECQRRWPGVVIAMTELTREGAPKGSSRVAYAFTSQLAIKRAGDRVSVTVGPSRYNSEGKFDLVLDCNRQRLHPPEVAAQAAKAGELRGAILDAVDALGTRANQTRIEEHVGGDNKRVRAELKTMLEEDVLVRTGNVYRRP